MKLISVVGARPNFVKIAPIVRAIRQSSLPIQHLLVHTGQHYDYEMSQVFFEDLELPIPDYHLGVGSGTHAEQTGRIMIEVEKVFLQEKPDVLLVVGDVNSTLAAALAAAKLQIPVAHVEAGVRMYDMKMPEEVNRVVTDHVSSLLFCPTQTAAANLAKEGLTAGVCLVGDPMLDTYLALSPVAERKSGILRRLGLERKSYLLATVHRQRNTDNEESLRDIAAAFLGVDQTIVFPVHPRTEKYLRQYALYDTLKMAENMRVIAAVNYLDSIMLTRNAKKVVTDSGGLQREAYFAGVPCITLDDVTAWVETVDQGSNTLVSSNAEKIVSAIQDFEPVCFRRDVFGDGKASDKIVKALERYV